MVLYFEQNKTYMKEAIENAMTLHKNVSINIKRLSQGDNFLKGTAADENLRPISLPLYPNGFPCRLKKSLRLRLKEGLTFLYHTTKVVLNLISTTRKTLSYLRALNFFNQKNNSTISSGIADWILGSGSTQIREAFQNLAPLPFLVVSHDSIRACVRPSVRPSVTSFFGGQKPRRRTTYAVYLALL